MSFFEKFKENSLTYKLFSFGIGTIKFESDDTNPSRKSDSNNCALEIIKMAAKVLLCLAGIGMCAIALCLSILTVPYDLIFATYNACRSDAKQHA